MDEDPAVAADEDPDADEDAAAMPDDISALSHDVDGPQAPGEETDDADPDHEVADADHEAEAADATDDGDDLGELSEDHVAGRRNALPRRVESWRTRSASGAIATALAMGLQQVFEPEKRRPAAVAEAPSDPYSDNDPVTVDYIPDDAESTTVHVKPWLLQKDDPV